VVAKDERERLLGEIAAADEPFVVLLDQQRRIALASLGKIPMTSARRPISRLSRSSGLVERSLDQWAAGKR